MPTKAKCLGFLSARNFPPKKVRSRVWTALCCRQQLWTFRTVNFLWPVGFPSLCHHQLLLQLQKWQLTHPLSWGIGAGPRREPNPNSSLSLFPPEQSPGFHGGRRQEEAVILAVCVPEKFSTSLPRSLLPSHRQVRRAPRDKDVQPRMPSSSSSQSWGRGDLTARRRPKAPRHVGFFPVAQPPSASALHSFCFAPSCPLAGPRAQPDCSTNTTLILSLPSSEPPLPSE